MRAKQKVLQLKKFELYRSFFWLPGLPSLTESYQWKIRIFLKLSTLSWRFNKWWTIMHLNMISKMSFSQIGFCMNIVIFQNTCRQSLNTVNLIKRKQTDRNCSLYCASSLQAPNIQYIYCIILWQKASATMRTLCATMALVKVLYIFSVQFNLGSLFGQPNNNNRQPNNNIDLLGLAGGFLGGNNRPKQVHYRIFLHDWCQFRIVSIIKIANK